MQPESASFAIVFVCTGNRFRSPLAEGLVRKLTTGLPVRVASLGLRDVGPLPPLPEALAAASRLGIDLSGHSARALRNERLDDVDLVVGFERVHMATAVVDCGASRGRTFTLPELAHLLQQLPAPGDTNPIARARVAVARAHGVRSTGRRPNLEAIGDPIGRSDAVYRQTAERVAALATAVACSLFVVTSPSPP